MNGNAAEMPKAVKIWAVVGFVFAALYLAIAVYAFTNHPENYELLGSLGLIICVLLASEVFSLSCASIRLPES